MEKNIYIFSGLGGDHRVFQRLDFSGYSPNYVYWITPHKNDTIEHYATRLLGQIKTTRPILIGLSLGGLIAIEIAKQIETEKVIIIASAKTKDEIPFYYRWGGQLRIHKLLSANLLKHSNSITNWFFGTTSLFDRQLIKQILIDTDKVFLKWAIDKVVRWSNTTKLNNLTHIHGTSDRILPFRFVNCNHIVEKGGHFMTVNNSDELTVILRQLLS